VRQKDWVEGSICKSYIEEEALFFFSYYFNGHMNLSFESVTRNDEAVEQGLLMKQWYLLLKNMADMLENV